MSLSPNSVDIRWKGLSREDIDSLHDFLALRKGIVTHVNTRVRTMDAAWDPSAHPILATIVGFSIGIGNAVGKKALDIATECVRDWIKGRQTEKANVEITLIHGPDKEVVAQVRKRPLPKPK
jgi:hypothetical protein